jgi:NADH pyrophosphatase NudC (nudix superfamily)
MVKKSETSIIVLTYKGKVLLTMMRDSRQALLKQGAWSFISGLKEKNESFEESIVREVEGEMHILINGVEFLSSLFCENRTNYLYHAALTDDNVNNIERDEGKSLDFFSLQELKKLPLTPSTRLFIERHKDLLEIKTPTVH